MGNLNDCRKVPQRNSFSLFTRGRIVIVAPDVGVLPKRFRQHFLTERQTCFFRIGGCGRQGIKSANGNRADEFFPNIPGLNRVGSST